MTHSVTFDTLLHSKKLQEKGFTSEQAEAQVEMIKEVIDAQLATKQDIRNIKREIQKLEYKLTIRFGVMLAAAIGILAVIIKF